MRAVRTVVRLARSIRERLGLKHRHPLPAMYAGGIDPGVLAAYADLLAQEVNVKTVQVLPDPARYVSKTLRLNARELGARLKDRLARLQESVASGDYAINPDGTLNVGDVVLRPDEYSYRLEAADPASAIAAEGQFVVLLDLVRDDRLRIEGDARDLNRAIQDLRKRAGLQYAERIVVFLSGSGLEPLLSSFGPWLMDQALAVALTTTESADVLAAGEARLASGAVRVAIGRAGSE
jgi:isoleucyl-tRNA synthetase